LFAKGGKADKIIKARGLKQVSDARQLGAWVQAVLQQHPQQVADYLNGNAAVLNWLFGQVVKVSEGKANPEKLRDELERQLTQHRLEKENG
jgi:Asp-tRNA(Asn)/Glu-tRNA(Gln) amidotransferase B subunit